MQRLWIQSTYWHFIYMYYDMYYRYYYYVKL